jgi:molybdopterin/thiamine biosynthesis adenylyltransferase
MTNDNQDSLRRYDRQIRFRQLGSDGQAALSRASVLVVGCGALGSVAADMLVRMGIGRTTIVDRDIVELHNLHRQPLFTEEDLREGRPKALAAEAALRAVNSDVDVRGMVEDFNYSTASRLARGADLIIDGTDNFETRLLINDLSLEKSIPWIYGGAIGADGVVKAIVPGKTSCFRCLIDEVPDPGDTPTCETAGVIAPAPHIVASLQVSLALRVLTGVEVNGDLLILDAWKGELRSLSVPRLPDCLACVHGERPFLSGEEAGTATVLCGSMMVQVLPPGGRKLKIDLDTLADRLAGLGKVSRLRFYLLFNDDSLKFTFFPDGRALVKGTDDPARARAAVARYLGG